MIANFQFVHDPSFFNIRFGYHSFQKILSILGLQQTALVAPMWVRFNSVLNDSKIDADIVIPVSDEDLMLLQSLISSAPAWAGAALYLKLADVAAYRESERERIRLEELSAMLVAEKQNRDRLFGVGINRDSLIEGDVHAQHSANARSEIDRGSERSDAPHGASWLLNSPIK